MSIDAAGDREQPFEIVNTQSSGTWTAVGTWSSQNRLSMTGTVTWFAGASDVPLDRWFMYVGVVLVDEDPFDLDCTVEYGFSLASTRFSALSRMELRPLRVIRTLTLTLTDQI